MFCLVVLKSHLILLDQLESILPEECGTPIDGVLVVSENLCCLLLVDGNIAGPLYVGQGGNALRCEQEVQFFVLRTFRNKLNLEYDRSDLRGTNAQRRVWNGKSPKHI